MSTSVPKQTAASRALCFAALGIVSLFFLFSAPPALAQPDTIPVLLQQIPAWHTWNLGEIVARGEDSLILTNIGANAGIWISTDRGITFSRRDSAVANASLICVPASRPSGQSSYGPIWQLDSADAPEFSADYGESWTYPGVPQHPAKGAVSADGVSNEGDLFWFSTPTEVILTRSSGNRAWDTLPFTASAGKLAFYDADHGVRSLGGELLARTNDGGLSWDTLTLPGNGSGLVSYPAPNIIFVAPPAGNPVANFVSVDTGRTWKKLNVFYDLQVVRDSLWYARTTRASLPNISNSLNSFDRSTDQGSTWQQLSYSCPNGPTYLIFGDSEHGVSLGTAQTDDGGYSWDCLDTTVYAGASTYIIPANFDASSYYDLAYAHGTNYVCISTDRGAAWTALFPYPTTVSTPWGVSLGRRLFIAQSDKVIWTGDFGQTFQTFKFNYSGSISGYVHRTPDGTLWASNDIELYVSRDTGNTWVDESHYIPYSPDSALLTYTFMPVDSLTGFVKALDGLIFRTTDAGRSWRPDSIVPTYVIDSRRWFNGSNYTTDAGATWRAISGSSISLAVDSMRWIGPGRYTTDAGSNWLPIPGWTSKGIQLAAVDSGTAFAGGFPTGAFWRLDMPFYTTPKPAAPDFTVDNQTWKNVPFGMDTGWIQLPVVIHNTSISEAIEVDFDSLSDPAHFSLASYQGVAVTVPKKGGILEPDGLDSVWFLYHPTAFDQDGAKAYWHSPQVRNGDNTIAVRTDSLHGNPSTASVAEASAHMVSLAPNPADAFVSIRGATGDITLTNVLGEIVYTGGTTQSESRAATLDLTKLPPGTYFARIETAGGLVVRKIVKE